MTSDLMAELKDSISAVSSRMDSGVPYSMYLRFTAGNLVIDTTSTDKDQNIFISLENVKSGNGQANMFTLNIAYEPNVYGKWNINYIDEALALTAISDGAALPECTLKYGYANVIDKHMVTKEYVGILTDYTSEIRDGLLYYTLTGCSGLVKYSEHKVNIEGSGSEQICPTKYAKTVIERYLKKPGSEMPEYRVVYDKDVEGSDQEVYITGSSDTNVFQFLDDLMNLATDRSQGAETSPSEKITYAYHIVDAVNEGEQPAIVITRTDPKNPDPDSPDIVFNWMSPGNEGEFNNLVIDFKTEFKGAILLAQAVATDPNNKRYTFNNETGEVYQVPAMETPPGSGTSLARMDATIERSQWAKITQFSYNAKLTLVGIPREFPIMGTINIVPLIYGQKHHSAGKYWIKSSTDIIDSSGFMTIVDVLKQPLITESDKADESTSESEQVEKKDESPLDTPMVEPPPDDYSQASSDASTGMSSDGELPDNPSEGGGVTVPPISD